MYKQTSMYPIHQDFQRNNAIFHTREKKRKKEKPDLKFMDVVLSIP